MLFLECFLNADIFNYFIFQSFGSFIVTKLFYKCEETVCFTYCLITSQWYQEFYARIYRNIFVFSIKEFLLLCSLLRGSTIVIFQQLDIKISYIVHKIQGLCAIQRRIKPEKKSSELNIHKMFNFPSEPQNTFLSKHPTIQRTT